MQRLTFGLILAIAACGCTSSRVVEATWDEATVRTINEHAQSFESAVVRHPRVPDQPYRIHGPIPIGLPPVTSDSLRVGPGFAREDVYEIAYLEPTSQPRRGALIGFALGAIPTGLWLGLQLRDWCETSGCPVRFGIVGGLLGGAVGGILGFAAGQWGAWDLRVRYRFEPVEADPAGGASTSVIDISR